MARKNNLKMTPLMTLAVFAIFAMMIPLFTLSNANSKASKASAQVVPTATPDVTEYMEK